MEERSETRFLEDLTGNGETRISDSRTWEAEERGERRRMGEWVGGRRFLGIYTIA